LLLNGHATDDCGHFDLLLELRRDDSFYMIFDLDCKLSGGRDDETFNAINFRRLLTVLLSLLKL